MLNDTAVLYRGTTSVWIETGNNSKIDNATRMYIHSALTDRIFNPNTKQVLVNNRFMLFDPKTNRIGIPINFEKGLTQRYALLGYKVKVINTKPIKGRRIDIKLNPDIVPRKLQVECINSIMSPPMRDRVCVEAQAGSGKTALTLMLITKMKKCTLIICGGLMDQWAEATKTFTDSYDDVWIIQGLKSLVDLMDSDVKPKIIIGSLKTISMFVLGKGNYGELNYQYRDFIKKFGVGLCVYDESHLCFAMNTRIDICAHNIPYTIYMTATFQVNATDTAAIFNTVYPTHLKIGGSYYKKYINAAIVGYISGVPEHCVMRARGYAHIQFEKAILKRTRSRKNFNDALTRCIDHYYMAMREPGEKCLIWMSTKALIDETITYLEDRYPNERIRRYMSADPRDNLVDVDIILSTALSCGVGTDIKQLRTGIQTVSIKAVALGEQIKSRLRELPGKGSPIYVDMWARDISRVKSHMFSRKTKLKSTCVEVETVYI